MAALNLKQITDKLNTEFVGEIRKLVFWYDANAEFAEDVDTLELVNAKVLHLEPDNQFYTKYFLECVDTTTNYLVYAPFAKPAVRENHLADTIKYSKEFFADRASLLTLDLGIDERFKPVIQHYIKFFGEKKRTQAFYDLELETFNRNTIEVALMSVICKCKTPSYEEVLRIVLTDAGLDENPYLEEFKKYDLLDAFWQQGADIFGYADEKPTLEKFVMTMLVTYAAKVLTVDVSAAWKPFVSFKSGNVIAFIDNLMNSYIYGERFDEISKLVYDSLKGDSEFAKLPVESLVSCGIFSGIDEMLIRWATERLELEDVAAKLGDLTIPQLLKKRRQEHFGKKYRSEYFVLENAWHIISNTKYVPSNSLNDMVKNYTGSLYQMDRRYRYFYYYLDKLEDTSSFDKLKELVENIYANDYLAKICTNWNDLFNAEVDSLEITKQPQFYNDNVQYAKENLVVIISDALRYEVGMTLFEKLQADEKCTATMKTMASTLPSITPYGMAALLPHETLELREDYSVRVDGQRVDKSEQRQNILQKYKPASRCVQYDDIKNMSVADLRSIFTRQEVVYIYHNQVDARGDKLNTENEVFNACEEAVEEISALIRRLTISANRSRFIVTADHGFLYRRNKLTESDKIASIVDSSNVVGRRYLLSKNGVISEGIATTDLSVMMQNQDTRKVSYPVGADVFVASDPGMNYVHGGCSPQEMLLPVIEVKTEKGYKETTTVQIALVSLTSKITNLITSLDFVQKDAVSDVVKETTYRIYFVDSNGEKISNEHLYIADKKDKDTVKRVFRLRFLFKNKKYDKSQKYYLVAFDDNNALEVLRHEVVMDIAFADDFEFLENIYSQDTVSVRGGVKMEKIEYLYHYTSLDTLALILKNKTICFNNLLYVDDIEESASKDMGNFGKYINVSCWTSEEKESIALWNLYTPNMHGVRIRMPIFPFKKYKYHKGEYFLDNDIETFIDIGRIYDDNKGTTTANQPKLIEIEYTDDDEKLYPKIKRCNIENATEKYLNANSMEDINESNLTITYSFEELGKYKRTDWSFQKEWRYIINFSPMGLKEYYPLTFKKQQEQLRRIENLNQPAPYNRFFLDLDENAIREMKVLFGPRMTESEKILAKALLKENDLSGSWDESKLKIR